MPSLFRPDREDRPATGDPCGQWLPGRIGALKASGVLADVHGRPRLGLNDKGTRSRGGSAKPGSLADRPAAEKEMALPDPRRIRSGISTVVRRRARGNRVGIALLVLSAVTLVGVIGEYVASGDTQLLLANGGWTASALAAVIGVTAATRRSARPDRAGWALLLCGCVAWLVGKLLWNAYSATSFPPSPNPADICWLAFAVAGAAGVHRLCRGASRSLGISLLEVAPLIAAVSALLVALLTNDLRTSRLSGAGQVTSIAYPIFYVSAALVMSQAVIAGALDLRRNHGMVAMLGGLVLTAIGFILWSPQLLTGTYKVGANAVDALWSVSMILIGVGAWASGSAIARAEAEPVSRRRDGALPALTFVILAGVQIALNAGEGGAALALSVGLSIVGVTLIAHAAVSRRHQAELFAQLLARERELRDVNILLRQQSRTDALTGLANRLRLREDFADLAARAKRYGQGYCLVLIDLDHFKDYNDDHGHQAGDLVLAQIADRLNETMRESDRAYRYGGEELLLILRDQGLDAGRALAERHRARAQRAALRHSLNTPHGVVTLSAGVAAAQLGETPEQVLRRADEALYEAKALGRNRIAVADPAMAPSHPAASALSDTSEQAPSPAG